MRTTTRTTGTPTGSTLRGIAVGIALLVTATACADGDTTRDTEADDPADVEAPVDDEPDADGADEGAGDIDDAPAADAVSARNINFEPADLAVAVGTTVTFTNEDIVRHTVTAGSPDDVGDAFDEELDSAGDTATITFDEPGTIDYFCRLHPTMTGTITVG